MKTLGSLLLCLLLSATTLAQQAPTQAGKPPKPQLLLTLNNRTVAFNRHNVFASKFDTLMVWQGKLADATPRSSQTSVVIGDVVVSLVRDTRRVDYVTLTNGRGSIASLAAQAQTGDRYVIQLDKITLKNTNDLKEVYNLQPVYLIAIR
ncbi:hypothetical protein BN8_04150 [Fibrisoma limi BUZ 3]|uniref:Uncharacterized protein n=1 Tax=Fibrisoma limi BUZ 3 TaxID=1185876 RepID=I2GM04_9BACT|nr:hypothetical protein [Fibrisoma limi]CCH54930.1 hypothetical protein BN8_04150 [Fibrisoma limi BUZ 3]